ncbi:hypothetical protein M413DRAFT_15578 [Hebeloma cylindrosporum]|uniref:Major facilitator superfamily (MFS) profile domain-containing protein n=1 Tax=Hebeloma cylindrosporum TaxID=76867 RepID=A0A0C3D0C7_HEBCY|nr:hypothetical protein M413DRAFT_15578 [Hebeloma cylindrosporum h7]
MTSHALSEAPPSRRTPLPAGQLSILMFLRFSEASSAFVIFPFLSELLASVTGGDVAKVGYYAGLMESIRQFLSLISVMYWSRTSDHIGRKPILLLGTFALSVSMFSFGLSSTFWGLVVSRCVFTAFNSNAGVIKSLVGEITDSTNSANAFALLHVPWAVGSSFGALTGGWLARPHDQFPDIFQHKIWTSYPYFLPTLVIGSLALFACFVVGGYLREVGNDSEASEPLLRTEVASQAGFGKEPVPLQSLLRRKVLIPIMNYTSIAALHAAHNSIQPLFLAMPIEIGGLGLPPRQVGYILGSYGIMNSLFQTFMLGRLVHKFGVKAVFVTAIAAFVPMFTFSPLMNILARGGGFSYILWGVLGLQLSCSLVMELGYGCVYMFITAAAPNKRSLGATNGLAQTLVTIGRIATPVMASSLLSISIQYRIFWGYAAYLALVFLSFGSIWLAYQLPRKLENGSR